MTAVENIDIGPSSLVAEGQRVTVEVKDQVLALVRVDGALFAIDDHCPHREGHLGQGDLKGHHLYCPLHAWCFDVRNGNAFFPKGATIACFDVSEIEGRIVVNPLPNNRPARARIVIPSLE